MQNDSLKYDSLADRPLPKWLIDQKEGLCEIQPKEIVMKEDHSLTTSFIVTGVIIVLAVIILSIYVKRKYKNEFN